jgi:hypothetical protein
MFSWIAKRRGIDGCFNAATNPMSSRLDGVKDWEGLAKAVGYTVSGLAKKLQCTDRQLRR